MPIDLIPCISNAGRRRTIDAVSDWLKSNPDLDPAFEWRNVDGATTWLGARSLDSGHLRPSANINVWADASRVHIDWDNRDRLFEGAPAWSAMQGTYSLPRERYMEEVRSFHQRLMEAMSRRVEQVAAGALGAEIEVDIPALSREHDQRKRLPEQSLAALQQPTDWEAVRAALRVVGALSGNG